MKDSQKNYSDDLILSVEEVKKHYPIREGALQRIVGSVRAVDGVSLQLKRGKTLGIVGESGCGKTTLGRLISGLNDPTSGGVLYGGEEKFNRIDELKNIPLRNFRRNCQMVFQDSFASLNPRHLVADIVGRPLKVYKEATGADLLDRVVTLLEQVGLGREHLYRYPHQFSGGQRQRISIARAIALNPEIIVLDEPTSALDVSVQAQILNLLSDIQKARNLAYIFITHDLNVVRHMADDIVVMYLGKVVEAGSTKDIFDAPHHPYTKALISAKPDLDKANSENAIGLEGLIPDPARPPQGCRFHTRCVMATPDCGWEVDDVIRWLEDTPGMFEELVGVERKSEFSAVLTFSSEGAAANLIASARSEKLPLAMRQSFIKLNLNNEKVELAFKEVKEVALKSLGHRQSACVLSPEEVSKGAHYGN
ncbi:MAG: ATP-binding cassette domain-containing protein [Paracoccaceae bacterium]|nr:ATP-binding cassette domain-containing protein [Paracoccaceae bacterium]